MVSQEKRREYNARYHRANRAAQMVRVRKASQAVRALMQYNKHWARCTDCYVKYPYWVNQYDHVRGTKVRHISRSHFFGRLKMLEEMTKCDIVCANCHAERTHRRC